MVQAVQFFEEFDQTVPNFTDGIERFCEILTKECVYFLFTNKSAFRTAKALDAIQLLGIYETFLYKTEN